MKMQIHAVLQRSETLPIAERKCHFSQSGGYFKIQLAEATNNIIISKDKTMPTENMANE